MLGSLAATVESSKELGGCMAKAFLMIIAAAMAMSFQQRFM